MGIWLIAAALLADPQVELPKGRLVVIGGGETPATVVNRTLELSGGKSAKIAVLPAANLEYGPSSVATWKRNGADNVVLVNPQQQAAAVKTIREANLIWLPGGLQGVFMNNIRGSDIAETIRNRYREGAIVGGTSAGAAVMGKTMIGGPSDLGSLKAGTAPYLQNGLGLWPDAIVDQHFLQKGRFNRLALAVIDYPDLMGVGIDEETAVVVRGREFEVIGNSNVTVIDGRKASREKLKMGEPAAARNLKIHVLRAGMTFQFDE
ncbi:MAG: cyanophycinase [Planctomycetota bacterium]|nr:MAG: cyanophycinase [Planctomycetota bacterium]GDY08672.1 cyanophycinase [Planctomycetia bacterium]